MNQHKNQERGRTAGSEKSGNRDKQQSGNHSNNDDVRNRSNEGNRSRSSEGSGISNRSMDEELSEQDELPERGRSQSER